MAKTKPSADVVVAVVVAPEQNGAVTKGPHRFQKGQPSPNPGGRPRGLAAAIRELYPAEKLRDAFAKIAEDPKTSNRDRLEALKWLGDRAWGKAPETHLVGAMSEEHRDMAADLTRDQLLALVETGPPLLAAPLAALPSETIVDVEPST